MSRASFASKSYAELGLLGIRVVHLSQNHLHCEWTNNERNSDFGLFTPSHRPDYAAVPEKRNGWADKSMYHNS